MKLLRRLPIALLLLCLPMLAACGTEPVERLSDLIAAYDIPHPHLAIPAPEKTPSCTRDGQTGGTVCLLCGEHIIEPTYIPCTGHTEAPLPGFAPTGCTDEGRRDGTYCTTCHAVVQPREAYTYGHRWNRVGCNQLQRCMSCDERGGMLTGHSTTVVQGKRATCVAEGLTDGRVCRDCGEVIIAQETIPMVPHQIYTRPAVAPTCAKPGLTEGQYCFGCYTDLVKQETIPALPHTVEIDPAVPATCTRTGLTRGEHCAVCQTVITAPTLVPEIAHRFTLVPAQNGLSESGTCTTCGFHVEAVDPDRYNSRAGYRMLGTLPRGQAMQTLYDRLARAAKAFHTNPNAATDAVPNSTDRSVPRVELADLSLDLAACRLVIQAFTEDNPLYYWISNSYHYWWQTDRNNVQTITTIALIVLPEYLDGRTRSATNLDIYADIQTMIVPGATPYAQAKACYDHILPRMTYLYEEDGETPKKADWAHSIVGYVRERGGVCESYADALQMTLSYAGVECMRVDGYTHDSPDKIDYEDSGHAWVYARMDDGNWYAFDPTWDDKSNGTRQYTYFCINDTQALFEDGRTFADSHTPYPPNGERILYPVPALSPTTYPARDADLAAGLLEPQRDN